MNGETVKIKHTEITGIVTATLHESVGPIQLRIRYADSNGLVVDQWYFEDDVDVVN